MRTLYKNIGPMKVSLGWRKIMPLQKKVKGQREDCEFNIWGF